MAEPAGPGGRAGAGERVALVTGASSGLGRATAVALARAGYRLVLHGRDRERLTTPPALAEATAVTGDLAVPADVERLAATALSAHGRVDLLVSNAGVGWSGPLEAMDGDRAAAMLAVNLAAPIALTRALLPHMLDRGTGRLAYVTSIAGRLGVAGEAVYAATKGGLDAFAESLRLELRGTGVAVTVLVPGVVDTPFFERRGAPYDRSRPRPLPAGRVAAALVRGVAGARTRSTPPAGCGCPSPSAAPPPAPTAAWRAGSATASVERTRP
ncbi:SDR family NAD(P)-dependent oxidoreductase [Actinomadura yumaensis]|uniref:SDR family NAD(P)-dependent oxidoreductase n=1 Tax=Actinomadura yumaensis TaxID=111807 RepID=UPI0036216097